MRKEVLRMEHVYVKYCGKYALSDFKLNVYEGELVALFGFSWSGIHEMGMVLSGGGIIERGRILVGEQEVQMHRPYYPEEYGIVAVHSRNNLVPDLTVAENLFFGGKNRMLSLAVSERKQERLAKSILEKFGIYLDVHQKAYKLSYYEELMIKMLKAYVKGAKLIVVNEIAALSYSRERDQMFRVLELLKADGIAVIWINQRIEYVQEIADRVVVVRDGKNVKNFYGTDYSKELLIQMAVEKEIHQIPIRCPELKQEKVLQLFDINGKYLKDFSLSVKKGQILGIWTNDIYTQREFQEIISGETQKYQGMMLLSEKSYRPRNYEEAVRYGVKYIDLMWYEKHGMPNMSIIENLMMENFWRQTRMWQIVNRRWESFQETRYRKMHPDWPVGKWWELSPDQQRVLLYERCCEQPGRLYLFTEPFTQSNYQMIEDVIRVMQELQEQGKTLILQSLNYQDLRRVCDEICLIKDGCLQKRVLRTEFDQIEIGDYS